MIKIQELHFKQLAIQVFSKLAESESQVSFSNIKRFGGYEYRHFWDFDQTWYMLSP
jgi:hypothetical protein